MIERFFRNITSRFRVLDKVNECSLDFVKDMIFAACCLHNFIIADKDRQDRYNTQYFDAPVVPYDFASPAEHRKQLMEFMWGTRSAVKPS